MRYLVSSLLVLPFLSSCVVAEQSYYGREYVVPAPRVEVQPHDSNRHYHGNYQYKTAPRSRVYYSSGGHVVVNSRSAHVTVPRNVHGHATNTSNLHGHAGNSGAVHGHANNNHKNIHGSANNVHGHNPTGRNVVIPPRANGAVNHARSDSRQGRQQGAVERHHPNSGIQNKAHGHG